MPRKHVLLIGGGGTLGSYASLELLKADFLVDVIALEPFTSLNRNLRVITGTVSDRLLTDLFAKQRYDAIIDFLLYPDAEAYKSRARLLLENTDQLIFLSSYRVYADEEHPIRETSPQLLHVTRDIELLRRESYALPKSRCEDFLRASGYTNWTIVRPLISFSRFRLDLVSIGAAQLLGKARRGERVVLPLEARDKAAGLGWAGNIGKMLARLTLNEKALGEDFTLGTGETRTWGEIAAYYSDLLGAAFIWESNEVYLSQSTDNSYMSRCSLYHDRLLDRTIDNSKLLAATGLRAEDFICIRDGLIHELAEISTCPPPSMQPYLK